MMSSDFALIFHRDPAYKTLLSQINNELEQLQIVPSLIVCTRIDWTVIEMELSKIDEEQYKVHTVEGYKRVNSTNLEPSSPELQIGWSALFYRKIPIVAMESNDDNIISARLKGYKNV